MKQLTKEASDKARARQHHEDSSEKARKLHFDAISEGSLSIGRLV